MNLISKVAIAAAATLALATIFNRAADDDQSYTIHSNVQIGDQTLPVCKARDGAIVQYVSNRSQGSPYAYTIEPGLIPPENNVPATPGAYIVLPDAFSAQMTSLMMKFIIAHECAHHRLGHTVDGSYAGHDIELMRTFEAEADCAAVQIMRRHYGMTEKDVIAGTEQFFRFLAEDTENDPTIHGTAVERHARALSCLP